MGTPNSLHGSNSLRLLCHKSICKELHCSTAWPHRRLCKLAHTHLLPAARRIQVLSSPN